jgi:hypothetical protein
LNNHLATIILVTPSRINGTVSNDSTPTTAGTLLYSMFPRILQRLPWF